MSLHDWTWFDFSDTDESGALTVTPLDFGCQDLGTTSDPLTLTVTNSGLVPLTNVVPSISSGPFAIVSTTCTDLAPGASCDVLVTFTPVVLGVSSGMLSVSSDQVSASAALSGLSCGAAAAPGCGLTVCPQLDFGCGTTGVASSPLTATITNLGLSTVTVDSVTSTDGHFSPTVPATPFTIAAGETQDIPVTFTGGIGPGAWSGGLIVTSDSASSPDAALMTGMVCTAGAHLEVLLLPFPETVYLPSNTIFVGGVGLPYYSARSRLLLINDGDAPLTITAISGTAWFPNQLNIDTSTLPIILAAGQMASVSAAFLPLNGVTGVGNNTACYATATSTAGTINSNTQTPVIGPGIPLLAPTNGLPDGCYPLGTPFGFVNLGTGIATSVTGSFNFQSGASGSSYFVGRLYPYGLPAGWQPSSAPGTWYQCNGGCVVGAPGAAGVGWNDISGNPSGGINWTPHCPDNGCAC